MKKITLTQGFVAIVDDVDFDLVSGFTWHVAKRPTKLGDTFYAASGASPIIYMHRLIMNASHDVWIDHEDHNGLNNRRSNLRAGPPNRNHWNAHKPSRPKKCSSTFKGVTWRPDRSRWRATIVIDYKQRFLGHFTTEIEAAAAYDKAAKELFGEFALLNLEKKR